MTTLPSNAETITDKPTRQVAILVAGEDITVTWSRFGHGERGPDLHVHHEHTDAFFILDGELTFALGPDAEEVRVRAGGFVAVPPHVAHAFHNDSGAEARWLNLHAPDGGFATFMRGMRDGRPVSFDSFDPPPGGGPSPDGVTLAEPGEGRRALAEFLATSTTAEVAADVLALAAR